MMSWVHPSESLGLFDKFRLQLIYSDYYEHWFDGVDSCPRIFLQADGKLNITKSRSSAAHQC